jgi:hypothetical protein
MPTADIEYWTARVAELERALDAETKLSKVNLIAAELMRTRQALKKAKATLGRSGLHPKHGSLRRAHAVVRTTQSTPAGA